MASLVTAAPGPTPSTCPSGYISCPQSYGGGCCGTNQACGPSYLTFEGDFNGPFTQRTAACYNGAQTTNFKVNFEWWRHDTPSNIYYNYHEPFLSQGKTPPGGGLPSSLTSSGRGRLFLTYSPGVCPSIYTTASLTYNSEAGVYGALCCRSGFELITTPETILVGTETSIDYGPACQATVKSSDGVGLLTQISNATRAHVTVNSDPPEYWSSTRLRTGTAQAYGIAVFFNPSDIQHLDPPPQTPIGTSIPSRTSSPGQEAIIGAHTSSSEVAASSQPAMSSSSMSPGVVAGTAIGATCAVLLLVGSIFAVFFFRRRKRRAASVYPAAAGASTLSPMDSDTTQVAGSVEKDVNSPVEIGSSAQQFHAVELADSSRSAIKCHY